jgi:hypothetical protein
LCGRETDNVKVRVIAKNNIEVVEVTASRAKDDDFFHGLFLKEGCLLTLYFQPRRAEGQ